MPNRLQSGEAKRNLLKGWGTISDLLPSTKMQQLGATPVLVRQRTTLQNESNFTSQHLRDKGFSSTVHLRCKETLAISPNKIDPKERIPTTVVRGKVYKLGTTTGNTTWNGSSPIEPKEKREQAAYVLGGSTQLSPKARQFRIPSSDEERFYNATTDSNYSTNLNNDDIIQRPTSSIDTNTYKKTSSSKMVQRKDVWPQKPIHSVTEDGLHNSYCSVNKNDRDFKGQLDVDALTGGYSTLSTKTNRSQMQEDYFWPDINKGRGGEAGNQESLFETTERRLNKGGAANLVSRSAEYVRGFRGRNNRFVEFVDGGGLGDTKCPPGLYGLGLGFDANSQATITPSRAEYIERSERRAQQRADKRLIQEKLGFAVTYHAPTGKVIVKDQTDRVSLEAMKGHNINYQYANTHIEYKRMDHSKRNFIKL